MGYYTNYTIEFYVTVPHNAREALKAKIIELNDNYDVFKGSCKWYEWQRDCLNASSTMPNVQFSITGYGEESGDMWRAIFKSGAMLKHEKWDGFPPMEEY